MSIRRYFVTGRVQGVGYRAFAATCAADLGLRGFVRNLSDGSVEVVAEGGERGLLDFEARLTEGPRSARVAGVRRERYDADANWHDFEIRYI